MFGSVPSTPLHLVLTRGKCNIQTTESGPMRLETWIYTDIGHIAANRNGQHIFEKVITESSFFQCFENLFRFKFYFWIK